MQADPGSLPADDDVTVYVSTSEGTGYALKVYDATDPLEVADGFPYCRYHSYDALPDDLESRTLYAVVPPEEADVTVSYPIGETVGLRRRDEATATYRQRQDELVEGLFDEDPTEGE